eukprot:6643097-Ditylum_brightwellii.AAC.1
MEEDTVDELVHDTSTQGIALGNNGSIPIQNSIHDCNQDDADCSLPTLSDSDLSLTTKPYKELENDVYCNQNYLKHFFKLPPNYSNYLPMPGIKTNRYVFPYKDDMYDTAVDNMSRETHNKYAIMKYNCKAIKGVCEDDPILDSTFNRHLHKWNWYHCNRSLRRQIHEWHGDTAFYTRLYAKIGEQSKDFPFKVTKSIGQMK